MNVNERIRMARLLNHISQQPEYAKKIGITVETANVDLNNMKKPRGGNKR